MPCLDFHRYLEQDAIMRKLRDNLEAPGREQLAASLRGLTLHEAERVLAKSMIEHGGRDEHYQQVAAN